MEKKPNPSSRVSGGILAPPLDEKAKEEYRKQWGFDPPEARVLLLPPEYRQKPQSGAQIEADRMLAEAKAKKPAGG
jgi:hypothetical protein